VLDYLREAEATETTAKISPKLAVEASIAMETSVATEISADVDTGSTSPIASKGEGIAPTSPQVPVAPSSPKLATAPTSPKLAAAPTSPTLAAADVEAKTALPAPFDKADLGKPKASHAYSVTPLVIKQRQNAGKERREAHKKTMTPQALAARQKSAQAKRSRRKQKQASPQEKHLTFAKKNARKKQRLS
jgi:hypothetical protein